MDFLCCTGISQSHHSRTYRRIFKNYFLFVVVFHTAFLQKKKERKEERKKERKNKKTSFYSKKGAVKSYLLDELIVQHSLSSWSTGLTWSRNSIRKAQQWHHLGDTVLKGMGFAFIGHIMWFVPDWRYGAISPTHRSGDQGMEVGTTLLIVILRKPLT